MPKGPAYQLHVGDAIEVMREMPPKSVDLIFADPPYFLSNDGFTVSSGKMATVNKGTWDKSSGFEVDSSFHESWISECLRLLKDDGSIFISGTYHSIYQCGYALQKLGCHVVNEIVWFKPNGAPALAGRNFTASHETIIWAKKAKSRKHEFNYAESKKWPSDKDMIRREGKQMRSVWSIPSTPAREKLLGKHPTQKPLELLDRIVALCSIESDTVLDPFCGSGTTGVACASRGRNFIGIDLSQSYINLTEKRILQAYEETKSVSSSGRRNT
jgi:site-specific DNA-methyltransferase (adenine-specific)